MGSAESLHPFMKSGASQTRQCLRPAGSGRWAIPVRLTPEEIGSMPSITEPKPRHWPIITG